MSAANISCKEKYSRCVALEEDYVHQVYESIGKDLAEAKDPMKDTVKKFLDELEPGSLVADIGCGDGRHLQDKDGIFSVGAERSPFQASLARQQCKEVSLGDNLRLPFRCNAFDAILSIGVLHHFTTKERRTEALKEISRVLKIGGKALITVQKHNKKISQDVLIPWFDIPNQKKEKECDWLENENSTYNFTKDDEEDEDSISLPSSDEDDYTWMNNAKYFPPKSCNVNHDLNSPHEFQRSRYQSMRTSKNVPNKQKVVQNDNCYNFVQRAFKRFSADNPTENDHHITSEFHTKDGDDDEDDNDAVPLDSDNTNEQKNFLNCCSFKLSESLQRIISDNYIELLNIDDELDTSNLNTLGECVSESLCSENSKLVQKKSSLMRSISDIFKNMNSLWSSKSAKSCSDLKNLGATCTVQNECLRNRLVRSRTTTTCSNQFDHIKSLEDIQELDMTVSEANQIISDVLDSSIQCVETHREEVSSTKIFTDSDIVNGNTLSEKCNRSKSLNSKDKSEYHRKEATSTISLIKEGNLCHTILDLNEENVIINKSDNYDFDQNRTLSKEMPPDLFSISVSNSKSDFFHSNKSYENDRKNSDNDKKDLIKHERSLLEAKLRKEYSFLYDDELDDDEIEKENAAIDFYIDERNEKKCYQEKYNFLEESDLKQYFLNDDDFYPCEKVKYETLESRHPKRESVVESVKQFERDNILDRNSKCGNGSVVTQQSDFTKNAVNPDVKCSNLNLDDEICKFDCFLGPDYSNSKFVSQNSSKNLQKSNEMKNCQFFESNTLGPFYDDDNEYIYANVDSNLLSYYSMPELYAMSEFYDEYKLYQNYLFETFAQELPNHQYPLSKYSDKRSRIDNIESGFEFQYSKPIDILSRQDIIEIENELQSQKQLDKHSRKNRKEVETKQNNSKQLHKQSIKDNKKEENEFQNSKQLDFSLMLESNDHETECIRIKSSIENIKRELCNNIQTAFISSNTSSVENSKLDNIVTVPKIIFENEKSEKISFPVQLKAESAADLNNKWTSEFCLNNKCSNVECFNSSIFFTSLGISRSCSSLLENENINRLVEIPSLSNISASQPSLKFSPKRDLKYNLNKYRLNEINVYHSLSSDILVDDDIFSNFIMKASEKNIYSKQKKCALKETKKEDDKSSSIFKSILEKSPHEVSYISSSNLNGITEICPKFTKSPGKSVFKPQSKTVEVTNNYKENVRSSGKLCIYGDSTSSESLKLTDASHFENIYSASNIQNSKHNTESINSIEKSRVLENCICPIADLSSVENKCCLNLLSGKNTPECVKSNEKSVAVDVPLPDFPNKYFSHENTFHTCSSKKPLDFSIENISETEPHISLSHLTESIHSRQDDASTTQTNNRLPTDDSFIHFSSNIHDEFHQAVVKTTDSNFTESLHSDTSSSVRKSDKDKTDFESECTNYIYGRIHEDGAAVVTHRYHHLFQEEELYDLIENNISDLHVLESFVEDFHLCIIAEKVKVWTI